MKITKFLLSIAILGLAINMSASVKINGLGSYFEYLIPDTETDIELFPSHLGDYESKYIQIFNNVYSQDYDGFSARNINFSIVPLASKLSFRINADIASNDSEPRIYLDDYYHWNSTYFDGHEYGAALVTNSISYELTEKFLFGCFVKYGANWKEYGYDRLEMEDLDYVIFEDIEEFNYDNDYLSAGLNFKFLSNFNTDISILYSRQDIEDYYLDERVFERFFSYTDEVIINRVTDEDSESIKSETEDMGISILLEAGNDSKVHRLFIESHYIQQLTDYSSESFFEDLRYEDDELDRERRRISENEKLEDMKIYTTTIGFGKTTIKDKWEISYGCKLYGLYGKTKRDESYYFHEFSQNIDPDTTYTDSTSVSGENIFEINDWKAAIEVPFGVSYKLNRAVQLFGGMGLKLIRQELEYFDENEFSRWETDRYITFGTTITPFECLKIDVNFGRDFAYFSTWQIDLKYLW